MEVLLVVLEVFQGLSDDYAAKRVADESNLRQGDLHSLLLDQMEAAAIIDDVVFDLLG